MILKTFLLYTILFLNVQCQIDYQCGAHLGCNCDGYLVSCVRRSLTFVPTVYHDARVYDLRLNYINKIQPGVFKYLKKLRQLYLNFNKIKELENNAFDGLSDLHDLFLYNNQIEKISPKAFNGLTKLTNLYLDRNKIVNIEPGTFTGLPSLNLLYLYNNKLSGLKKEAFDRTNNLQSLRLDGNTLNCDCDLIWLKELSDSRYGLTINGVCFLPPKLLNRRIVSVATDEFNCVKELKFVQLPQDKIANEGSNVEFNCQSSDPNSRIKWLKDFKELSNSHFIDINPNGQLLIRNIRIDDEGFYVCSVSRNENEEIFAQSELVVNVQPLILKTPENVNTTEGATVEFECSASGKPKPEIEWFKDDEKIDENLTYYFSNDKQVLKVRRVNRIENSGVFTCEAKNDAGVARSSAQLIIRKSLAPIFIRPTQNISVYEDHSISLNCLAYGEPEPQVLWYKNGQRLITDSRVFFEPSGLLVISEVKLFDSGEYLCKATNAAGIARHSFSLSIKDIFDNEIILDSVLDDAVLKAKDEVNKGVELTLKHLQDRRRPRTSGDLLALLRYPRKDTLNQAVSEEVFERALELIFKYSERLKYKLTSDEFNVEEILTHRQMQRIADLTGCARHKRRVNCSTRCLKYRTIDGTCNNIQNPHWGAASIPLRRLLPAEYENGFSTPKGWTSYKFINDHKLPNPRLVSSRIISTRKLTEDSTFSHMLMQWGQFFDHDLSHTAMAVSLNRFSNGVACRDSCTNEQPCFPIEIPQNDTRAHDRGRCMEFVRSSAICGTAETGMLTDKVLQREQINQITSYIDASNVYGSTDQDAFDLRDRLSDSGLLKLHINSRHPKGVLPFNLDTPMDCHRDNTSQIGCFLAGDYRANEQMALLAMHNLWVRQHNRMALKLKEQNPLWTNEKLYQEARKIIIAQMQHITYEHWLPYIFGKVGMSMLGPYKGYNESIDVSISNEFATAAFRFGHALIQPFTFRLNSSYKQVPEGHLLLRDSFFGTEKYFTEGGMDPILRGLFATPAKLKMPREIMNSELTEMLFHITRSINQDLAALNIQRGRDHGLPGYSAYRSLCGLKDVNDFEDLKEEISSKEVRKILHELYGDVRNIDLWPGGILEDVIPGTKLGPLFMCLLTKQMKVLRDGDRFWYENKGVFTPSQLEQIKKTNLAKIICENSDNIDYIQKDVFKNAKYPSGMIECKKIEDVSLDPWKDCCEESNADSNCHGLSN